MCKFGLNPRVTAFSALLQNPNPPPRALSLNSSVVRGHRQLAHHAARDVQQPLSVNAGTQDGLAKQKWYSQKPLYIL